MEKEAGRSQCWLGIVCRSHLVILELTGCVVCLFILAFWWIIGDWLTALWENEKENEKEKEKENGDATNYGKAGTLALKSIGLG